MRDGERVTTGSEPRRTREEALALAAEWADGKLSHLNELMAAESSPENRAETLARCAEADAAEVVKWSALAQALPEAGEPGHDERTEARKNIERMRELSEEVARLNAQLHGPWQPDPRTVKAVVEALREQAPESAAYISNLGNALNYAADFVTERFNLSSEGTDG